MNQDPFQNPNDPLQRTVENPYQATGAPMQNDPILAEIKKQATASLIWGIVGIFCCGIILGPFAIWRSNKAKQMIAQHNRGHEYSGQATAGLICGIVALVLNLLGIVIQIIAVAAGAANG